jgi:hypothetical protein
VVHQDEGLIIGQRRFTPERGEALKQARFGFRRAGETRRCQGEPCPQNVIAKQLALRIPGFRDPVGVEQG